MTPRPKSPFTQVCSVCIHVFSVLGLAKEFTETFQKEHFLGMVRSFTAHLAKI